MEKLLTVLYTQYSGEFCPRRKSLAVEKRQPRGHGRMDVVVKR